MSDAQRHEIETEVRQRLAEFSRRLDEGWIPFVLARPESLSCIDVLAPDDAVLGCFHDDLGVVFEHSTMTYLHDLEAGNVGPDCRYYWRLTKLQETEA